MNFRPKSTHGIEVFSGSLSDIMFFLMLFFLITSTLISPSVIKVLLPQAAHSDNISKTEIALTISKDLKYYINNNEVKFSEIESELKKITTQLNNNTVVVRCDNSISVQSVVDVIQQGSHLNLKMVLSTRKE
jgi:biopolymer transport protein ExbD